MIVNFLELVNKSLISRAEEADKNRDRDYRHFHPSEWDDCKRRIAYAYYEAKRFIAIQEGCLKIDPQLERIFGNGHFMHDRWRSYLERVGGLKGRWQCSNYTAHRSGRAEHGYRPEPYVLGMDEKLGILRPTSCPACTPAGGPPSDRFYYREVSLVDKETMWGGSVDAIVNQRELAERNGLKIKIEPEEEHILVDFKSMNSFYFKKLDGPKSEHITQMQIYLYLTGLTYGKFLYEDKNYQTVKEFLVKRDENLLSVKKAEAIELKNLVMSTSNNHRLPIRAYGTKSHTRCLSCKYRGHCWDAKHDKKRAAIMKKPKLSGETHPTAKTTEAIGEADV